MARRKGQPQGYSQQLKLQLTPEDFNLLRELGEKNNDTAQEMVRIAIRKTYHICEEGA